MNDEIRIGIIYPGGGAEHEYYIHAEKSKQNIQIFLALSRHGGTENNDHDVEELKKTARIDWICEAADRILCLDLNVLFYACTSGSFVLGRSHAEKQIQTLKEKSNLPAGSTSLAFVKALNLLKFERIGLLGTYPEDATLLFLNFLNEFNIKIQKLDYLDASSGWDASKLEEKVILEKVLKLSKFCDCILLPDTALPSMDLIDTLQSKSGKIILSANQVSLWDSISMASDNIDSQKFLKEFIYKI